jgi:GGDEF domain-containing protein
MRKDLLGILAESTPEQLYSLAYQDPLTGLLNRRAFDLTSHTWVAVIDMDSLKYINDTMGYRKGDECLVCLAHELKFVFGDDHVYRLSNGDEFAVIWPDAKDLVEILIDLQKKVFTYFSFGIGISMDRADLMLKQDKVIREGRGERAKRGQRPPWATHLPGSLI